ncbi:MAG: alpha-glucosidase/alpha-galactosidase [Armatimonadetes bacterium]|nr:alpha-glucosidase/alpha-galactosidase [Armatimonadota bacterium]
MNSTKVVIIGAGSVDFGPGMCADVLANPDFRGSTLSLVDIDGEKVALMKALALRMNEEWGTGVTVEAATDRRQALPEAEFVLVAVERERMKRWEMDFEIALEYGVRQPFSENGGPGGFAHATRNIALVTGICKDMRELCPDAWFFNYTNPVPRITLAAFKYGGVKAAGFCHGIGIAYENVSKLLGIDEEDLDIKAAGLNHFTWILDVRKKSTGDDLYPTLRAKINDWPERFLPLTRDLFELTDLYPVCSDSHIAEYLQWVCDPKTEPWKKYRLNPPHLGHRSDGSERREQAQEIRDMVDGKQSIDELKEGSGERAVATLEAIVKNSNSYELAINIPNEGYVTNLPHNAIVEVPALVSAIGIRGLPMGDLPEPVGELCRRQVVVAELVVKAAATGDKKAALHALLMDPMVTDLEQGKAILEGYLKGHGDMFPHFTG